MTRRHERYHGDPIDLEIVDVAFGGEGVGKWDVQDVLKNDNKIEPLPEKNTPSSSEKALAVFVEDTVPGDHVRVQITTKKKNWARGFVKEIIQPSSLRITPRCRHFGSPFGTSNTKNNTEAVRGAGTDPGNSVNAPRVMDLSKDCGGCVWQYLAYEKQLAFKEQQVRDALKRIGGMVDAPVLPIIGMKDPWFYRNKMEFSFQQDLDGKIGLGLHLKRRHHDVTELTECFLLAPYVGDLVKGAREFFKALLQSGRVDPSFKLLALTVREGKHTDEKMALLTAENVPENIQKIVLENFQNWIQQFFGDHGLKLTSLFFIHVINRPGQRKRFEEKLLIGSNTIEEQLALKDGDFLRFQISPLAFFQPNTFQAEVLYQQALEGAALTGKEIVYDLFCGTGTIGIFCARKARKVYGIELNASAIENARANASLNDITNIEFLVGDVGKTLPALKEKADVVLVDPPRNGLDEKVLEQLLQLAASRLVYVSCNPTTLARDLAILTQKDYRLKSVQPVDMFPQTYHIECVAVLERIQQ